MRSNPIGHTIFFTRDRITNHKPDTTIFACEENRIRSSFDFISLVPVNTNTALPWRIFLNVKRRIQVTKKPPKSECKKTKYQEPKERKHNNRLYVRKPCKCRLKTLVADWNRNSNTPRNYYLWFKNNPRSFLKQSFNNRKEKKMTVL